MAPPDVLSIVPPFIVNVPPTAPNAAALLILSVPALSVVPPEKELAPERESAPAPAFVKLNPPAITPPTVKVLALVVTRRLPPRVTLPAPNRRLCVPIKVKSPFQF